MPFGICLLAFAFWYLPATEQQLVEQTAKRPMIDVLKAFGAGGMQGRAPVGERCCLFLSYYNLEQSFVCLSFPSFQRDPEMAGKDRLLAVSLRIAPELGYAATPVLHWPKNKTAMMKHSNCVAQSTNRL